MVTILKSTRLSSRLRTVRAKKIWAPILLLAILALAACQPVVDTRTTDGTQDAPAEPAPVLDETQQALVERASEMMADELGVDVEAVELVSIEAVDWPDSSLGCPQPDMMYAAMITPGYAITLQADGTTQVYHTTTQAESPIVTCEA